ncbi:hypothetical protein [Lacticaseibacillus hulanensis]|uniref:hypothetical protein n=1 Tax=Lacticaseibacillus hulanensis TaxID=2493111 RepID=UPI000FDA1D64|nr:hypothetical protein [Lacticaseibacillus hulanensis]
MGLKRAGLTLIEVTPAEFSSALRQLRWRTARLTAFLIVILLVMQMLDSHELFAWSHIMFALVFAAVFAPASYTSEKADIHVIDED